MGIHVGMHVVIPRRSAYLGLRALTAHSGSLTIIEHTI